MDVMLRPSEFDRIDDWRRAVLEAVKALTGADGGAILVNSPSGHVWLADYPRTALDAYGVRLEAMAPGIDLWARHAALGVHHRDEVWLPIRPDFYETRYYRDYLRPMRAFDALGTTWYRGKDRSPSSICQLLLHHESERGRRFGSREKALLDLVGPALRAGTEHALLTAGDIETTLDSLAAAVALLDEHGKVLHFNPVARVLLQTAPETEALVLDAAREAVRSDGLDADPGQAVCRRLTAGRTHIDLRLTRIPLGAGRGTGRLMTLHPLGEHLEHHQRIARAVGLGLTKRQAAVAVLLAQGQSNKAIARLLDIRPKTARRHTEDIFRRLGIARRGEVASILASVGLSSEG